MTCSPNTGHKFVSEAIGVVDEVREVRPRGMEDGFHKLVRGRGRGDG